MWLCHKGKGSCGWARVIVTLPVWASDFRRFGETWCLDLGRWSSRRRIQKPHFTLIVTSQQNTANKTRHNRPQVTLLIRCQLLHVSTARCHRQAVYQQQRSVGPTPSLPRPKLQASNISNSGPHTNTTSAHTSCTSNTTQRPAATAAHSQHFVLPEPWAQTSLSIPDPKGSPPAEAYDVSCARVQRAL